jgi:NAD(P)-dependent dehydrogenase (short-subunit alcohol dehydrogenase family)
MGLGLETALHLAAQGFAVYASVPDLSHQAHVEEAAAALDLRVRVVLLDVTDESSIATAVQTVMDECGGIYGLVNNAGLSLRGYFEDVDDDEIRRLFDVNLFGVMAVTRAVLPHMRQARRGRLIFVSSIAGRIAAMARTAYCASKFGLEGFAEALMQEVAPLGIRVSVIEPAIVKTERWTVNRGIARRATNEQGPYYDWFRREERLADRLVQSSPTTAADVAHAIAYALTTPQPQLRYVVGRRARLVLTVRRYLPGELFERLYFGEVMRRVTGFRVPR